MEDKIKKLATMIGGAVAVSFNAAGSGDFELTARGSNGNVYQSGPNLDSLVFAAIVEASDQINAYAAAVHKNYEYEMGRIERARNA